MKKDPYQLSTIIYILSCLIPLIPSGSLFSTFFGGIFWFSFGVMISFNKKIKTIGFLHSFPIGLPLNLIKRDGAPKKIIVSSDSQFYCLKKFLGWKSELSLKDALNSAWKWEKKLNLR